MKDATKVRPAIRRRNTIWMLFSKCAKAGTFADMKGFIFLLAYFVLTTAGWGQPVLVLEEGFEESDLAPFCRVYKIRDSTARPDEIARLDPLRDFVPAPKNGLNFGYDLASYWVIFEVENNTKRTSEWMLDIPNPLLSTLYLYQKTGDSLCLKASTGLLSPVPPTEMSSFYHFPIQLKAGERARFYLFANVGRTAINVIVPAKLFSQDKFLQHITTKSTIRGFFAGAFLILMVLALFLHLTLRDRRTFWLVFTLYAAVIFQLSEYGIFLKLHWGISRHLVQFFFSAVSGLVFIGFIFFFVAFYDLEKHLPKLSKAAKYTASAFFVVMGLQSFRYWVEISYMEKITYFFVLTYPLPALFIFAVSWYLFLAKRSHYYLLFAEVYSISLCGMLLFAIQRIRKYTLNFDLFFIISLSILIEFLLLLFFVRDSILRLRRDHTQQQLALAETRAVAAENLLRGQQEERRRLRLRLHDGLGILLASVRMQLSKFAKEQEALRPLEGHIAAAAAEIRHLSHDLDPEPLREGRLIDALNDMIGRAKGISDATILFSVDEKLTENGLPQRFKVALYYIAQELLHNALKHANATEVNLFLAVLDEKKLFLKLEDNGQGIPSIGHLSDLGTPPHFKGTVGIGLENIRARVAAVGGTFEMRPRSGGGLVSEITVFWGD